MCSLFFDKNSDLLIMLVATILKDLTSGDVHEIVICLTSLGNIMNTTIASSISGHVTKLLTHTTDLVRKKAILILQKIRQETGTAIPEYKEMMKNDYSQEVFVFSREDGYVVQMGDFSSRDKAESLKSKLRYDGIECFIPRK